LKTKDEEQVELEKREQGFSVYINGANRDFTGLPTARRTKTADGMFPLYQWTFNLITKISFKL
jgi:hypothetical protein